MINYLGIMAICLLITIVAEVSLARILGIKKLDLVFILLANILTNPLLNALLYFSNIYLYRYYNCIYITLEILIVFIEGFIYKKCFDYKKKIHLLYRLF